jgi:intraflagellar transport protein 20
MSKKVDLDIDITIDEDNSIRILSAEKYSASEKLKGESNKFVTKILAFNELNKNLNEILEKHQEKITQNKLIAIGKRNQYFEELDSREKKEKDLSILIQEKKKELNRLKSQFQSFQEIEKEQVALIEKLSNNE